jgi:catechol 2,3-dioxygenase-like lactoylglutathione lyase family enzyme
MIGYVTIGSNDIDRSVAFYDPVMGALGYEQVFKQGGWAGYAPPGQEPVVMVCSPPFNGETATFGNGMMVALTAPSRAAVEAFHKAALANGGKDEGAPGVRGEGTWFGAYVRDPVGNKICAFNKG